MSNRKDDPTPQSPAIIDAHPDVPATREEIAHAVHELRNSMNTLLMNAAVLGAGARNAPESLRPFIEQIAKAGRRCSEDLTRLFELVENSGR